MRQSLNNKVQYQANGLTTVFSYSFPITDISTLVVIETYNGVDTPKTNPTDYTATYGLSGGQVTFKSAPLSGRRITIKRLIPLSQLNDWQDGGAVSQETFENSVDKLTDIAVQLQGQINSAIKFKETSTFLNVDFPDLVANKALKVNSSGTGLEWSSNDFDTIVQDAQAILNATQVLKNNTNDLYNQVVILKDASQNYSTSALASKSDAHNSEIAAATSASQASQSAAAALVSQNAAATSSANAATSEANALAIYGNTTAMNNAVTSATASKNAAATSEANALASKSAAQISATNAATSESNALGYKNAAQNSATNAATSEQNAYTSAASAATSATNAATSVVSTLNAQLAQAQIYQDNTQAYSLSAQTAKDQAIAAANSATNLVNNAGLGDMKSTNNLSDLSNILTARTNLGLATVASSGSYNDLSNKPSLFDGNYNSLSNKPSLFDGNYNSLTNKPSLFDGDYNSLSNKPALFDGNYNSLSNKPTLGTLASKSPSGGSGTGTKFLADDDTYKTIAGGGPSKGTNSIIRTNGASISENIALVSGAQYQNGCSFGPIMINTGYTVTIPTGCTWRII